MTFDELIAFFDHKSYRAIGREIDVSPSQLTYYKKNGIPRGRQATIELQTGGKLKADISPINADKQ